MEEVSSTAKFLEGKTVLITGATGFLAKILLEKILRIQPNVRKIFLLIRATKSKSLGQRFSEEIIETELFRVLREKWGERLSSLISEKVVCVAGDVSLENLGIQCSELRDQMWSEIDLIVNSAATTKFDERYDVAFGINTFGAINALNFAKKCVKIKVFLHVSTAFVWGEQAGVIEERPFCMGETLNGASYLDIDVEKKLVDERIRELRAGHASSESIRLAMKDFGAQRAKLHGWPNTYVFTKAMGEMLLEKFKENVEVVIIRPTIISSTYQEPFPGWIQGARTLDSLIVAYGKGNLKCFLGDLETTIDLIPSDMVVNLILVAVTAHANQSRDQYVYHIGSSRRNPLKYADIHAFSCSYFIENPWINGEGKVIKVGKLKVLSSMAKFHTYIATHYLPLLKVIEAARILFCWDFEATYINFKRKINSVLRLAELYKPYLFFQGIFDDSNTANLQIIVRESEPDIFNFNIMTIKWKDYLVNTHLPNVVKYLF